MWLLIALMNTCTKYELHLTSECKCLIDALVAMVTRFPWQQDHLWILIALTNKCTKYELYLTSECKVICNSQLAMRLATRTTSIFPIWTPCFLGA